MGKRVRTCTYYRINSPVLPVYVLRKGKRHNNLLPVKRTRAVCSSVRPKRKTED